MRLTVKSADDRAALIDAARTYAEEIAADDLRELREQTERAWTYASECFAAFARGRRFDDPDVALAVMEDVVASTLRRRLIEAEEAALWRELDAIEAADVDVCELLAYADAWDADVAAFRAGVQEVAQ